jgi:hypothetical protein
MQMADGLDEDACVPSAKAAPLGTGGQTKVYTGGAARAPATISATSIAN